MFNKKELKELNDEYVDLRNMIIELREKVNKRTSIIVQHEEYDYYGLTGSGCGTSIMIEEKRVSIKHVLKELLRALGYEIICEYHPEKEEYSLRKITQKRKSKTKKGAKSIK